MKIISHKTEMAWLADRRKGIGASEAAMIYGIPGYRSIRRIWADKRGEGFGVFNNNSSDLDQMGEAGHRFEEANSIWFQDKTGKKVTDPGKYAIHWSEENSIMFCTPDRFIVDDSGKSIALLELKLAFHRQARVWSHMVPLSYMIQMQWQMFCCNLETSWISVILNGYQHTFFEVKRHERTIKELIRRASWFWGFVEKGLPPPVCQSSDMTHTLQDQYPEAEETRIDLDYQFSIITEQIDKDTEKKKELERKIDHNKNLIRDALGPNTTGVLIDGENAWHWKQTARGRQLRKGKVFD